MVVPRKEYEALLSFRTYREVRMTKAQKQALRRAEKNFSAGQTLSYQARAVPSLVNDITTINAYSRSFDFLKNEPDLYSLSDLRKRYA